MSSTDGFDPAHVAGGRRLGSVLARVAYDARALDRSNVPSHGPVVIVSNHTGFLDGPMVFCLAPRPVHFLVKRSYFTSVWGVVLRGVGQIPITQHTGDRQALQAAQSVLSGGGCVGVFPEGTRGSGSVQTAQQGAAWLAVQSGAMIVPTATLGTRGTGSGRESWPRPRGTIRVVFGEPFGVIDIPGTGRERLRVATELIRTRLADQVHDAVRRTGLPLPQDTPAP